MKSAFIFKQMKSNGYPQNIKKKYSTRTEKSIIILAHHKKDAALNRNLLYFFCKKKIK